MSPNFQTIAALVVVTATAAWFIRRAITRRKTGCGSDCGGCESTELKAKLKR